jgi:DNA-directed RNA polymerase specialized sigma24 family protein
MTATRGGRAPRELRPESFEALLQALAPDRERAGERYEAMRDRLLRFFNWRGVADAEDLADETFDRVSRRLGEGEHIRAPDLAPYVLGVARNVLREAWERDRRRWAPADAAGRGKAGARLPETEPPALECLLRCLQRLPAETRELVLLYYDEDGSRQVEHRRRIAGRLGVGPNALRIRLHRLRARLEQCVNTCLERQAETSRSWDPQRNRRPKA